MNKIIFFLIFIASLTLTAQESDEFSEVNRLYIQGNYENSYSILSKYLTSAKKEDISDKVFILGEKVCFFYIRSLFSRDDNTDLTEFIDLMKKFPKLKSERVVNALRLLEDSSADINSIKLSDDNLTQKEFKASEITENSMSYDNDELRSLLKQSLLKGESEKNRFNQFKVLIISMFILLSLLLITLFFSLKRALKESERKKIRKMFGFSTVILGSSLPGLENNDRLISKCRKIGQEIDLLTGRKNNSINISELVYKIAKLAGYSDRESLLYFVASMVYDIGFLEFEASFFKNENLSDSEFNELKKHTKIEPKILDFVPDNYKELFISGITMHHENMDGSGYPAGIKGDKIPFLPRVLRVAESFISQTSLREYKSISDKESAIKKLRADGTIYDQKIVDILDRVI